MAHSATDRAALFPWLLAGVSLALLLVAIWSVSGPSEVENYRDQHAQLAGLQKTAVAECADIRALQKKLKDLQTVIDLRQGQRDRFESDRVRIEKSLAETTREFAKQHADFQATTAAYEKAKKDESPNEDELSDKVDALETVVDDLLEKLEGLRSSQRPVAVSLSKIDASLKSLREQKTRLKEQLAEIEIGRAAEINASPSQLPTIADTREKCLVCHRNAKAIKDDGLPEFPRGSPRGSTPQDWVAENSFPAPYATHPRAKLLCSKSGPHATLSCTDCHNGHSQAVTFRGAGHATNGLADVSSAPTSESMLPTRFAEASCLKCHSQPAVLGRHPELGNTAPKLYAGYQSFVKNGCYACHTTRDFQPDTWKKPGPALAHIAAKLDVDAIARRIENPHDVQSDPKMPRVFGLENQSDETALRFAPIEIAAMAQVLAQKSTKIELLVPQASYEPDAKRGRQFFVERGCLACHTHEKFPDAPANDFGPELSSLAKKLKAGKDGFRWLHSWIRDPQRHNKNTRMPKADVEPFDQEGKRVEPAADIAAFLLEGAKPKPQPPATKQPDQQAVAELAELYAEKYQSRNQAKPMEFIGKLALRRYGCANCHDIPDVAVDGDRLPLNVRRPSRDLKGIDNWLSQPRRAKRIHTAIAGARAASEPDGQHKAFYYSQLLKHREPGVLWQKVRAPRTFDGTKLPAYLDRRVMPQYQFSKDEPTAFDEQESLVTFLLGLQEKWVGNNVPRPKQRIIDAARGAELFEKYNCQSCHQQSLPRFTFAAKTEGVVAAGTSQAQLQTELAGKGKQHPRALDLLLKKLRPPRDATAQHRLGVFSDDPTEAGGVFSFHGVLSQSRRGKGSYTIWESARIRESAFWGQIAFDSMLLPKNTIAIEDANLLAFRPGLGGEFSDWLVTQLLDRTNGERDTARQLAPPPLVGEGQKVRVAWLDKFLKKPFRLRRMTVLVMPDFRLSDADAKALSVYFAARENVRYPLKTITQTTPEYLAERVKQLPSVSSNDEYLLQGWKLLNGKTCIGCHSVGNRKYVKSAGSGIEKRGPDLVNAEHRLRPDWLEVWLAYPNWLLPYTQMPPNYPYTTPNHPQVLDGKAADHVRAVRDALLNYESLQKKYPDTLYEPPKKPGGTP